MVEKGRRILIKDGLLDEANQPVAFSVLPNDVKVRTLGDRINRLTERMSLMTTGMTDYCFKLEERLKILEKRRKRVKKPPAAPNHKQASEKLAQDMVVSTN